MDKEFILNGNESIVKFMEIIKKRRFYNLKTGYYVKKESENTDFPSVNMYVIKRGNYFLHDLKYHKSWDWLMPVVEKIESLEKYRGAGKEVSEDIWMFLKYNSKTVSKIQSVYEAVVNFIEWYNKNK